MSRYVNVLFFIFLFIGVALRILLLWVNPINNEFDNHYEPILWIIMHGKIPPKDLLWQSYQPPVFYVVSAMIGKLAILSGISAKAIPKILQSIPCVYGIFTLGFLFLILKKLPLSNLARLLSFGIVCFLPAHIYISAIHSNDTITYLCLSICIYLMLIAYERNFPYRVLILLSFFITVTLFTKYTSYVILPVALAFMIPFILKKITIPKKKLAAINLLIIVIPIIFLGNSIYNNIKKYNTPMPWNKAIYNPSIEQPRAEEGLSFISFKPWETIRTPILAPGNLDSFWTLMYSRMWFDMEPKFLKLIDHNYNYWKYYYRWLRGEGPFPKSFSMSPFTYFIGSTLITLGLIPLLLIFIGIYYSIKRFFIQPKAFLIKPGGMIILPVLLLFNVAIVVALTIISPVYSSIKAIYLLNSLPALAFFMALGVMVCERNKIIRRVITLSLCVLFLVVSIHIIQIVWSSGFKLSTQIL